MPILKDLATVHSGYSFREAIEPDANGQFQVIQIKDITANNRLSDDNLLRTNVKNLKENYLVRKNDILFISRGTRRQAVAITDELENTIAGNQFFIITLNPNADVIPEYLAWYINQQSGQKYLDQQSRGSNVLLVTKDTLEDMPIKLLDIELQKKIVYIYQLSLKEQDLLEQLKEKRKKLIDVILLNTLENKLDKRS